MHSDSLPPGTRLSSESVDAVTNRSGACEYITGEADAHLVVATHSELSPPPLKARNTFYININCAITAVSPHLFPALT